MTASKGVKTARTAITATVGRVHLPSLSALTPSTSRLNFRSVPFQSPPHLLFPPSSPSHHHTSNPLFSLRTFPSPSRSPRPPHSLSPLSKRHLPTPPPTLLHTTSPSPTPFLTPCELRAREIHLKYLRKPYTMDLTIMVGKKKVSKSAVIRLRCARRFKEAVRMVVGRGAYGDDGEVGWEEDNEGARKWLVRGNSYVANATLELYRHPFPDLVDQVRKSLKMLKVKAEKEIFERQMMAIPAPPPEPETRIEHDEPRHRPPGSIQGLSD